jgi:hypothetical protein
MPSYGRQQTATTGLPIQVLADSSMVGWKSGGITIDWATVTAVGSDTTLADGNVIKNGQKGLVFGMVLCKITASGLYGPYNSGAADGRQTLARGDCWVLNQTVLQNLPNSLAALATDNPPVFNAGRVFFDRLQIVGTGAALNPLGATSQPARAAFETAFPGIDYVQAAS